MLDVSVVVSFYAEDAAPNRNDSKALGLMCVLQARAKAQTAPRLQFE
jgi:hypothetical protein